MILLGDCLERLKEIEDNSVDAVVTDPPYGLSFMGKKWDYDVPSIDLWREVLRVLKPGGHMLAFGGTRTYHRLAVAIEEAGFEIRDQIQWLYGSGFPKSYNGEWGGTALKPANEPICLARKPLSEKTVKANFLKWGVGGLNIDESRIGTEQMGGQTIKQSYGTDVHFGGGEKRNKEVVATVAQGRWPANVLLDETAGELINTQIGRDVAKYFYCEKASKRERNAGLEGMPEEQVSHMITGSGKPSGSVQERSAEGQPNRFTASHQNTHPTVKPIKLMEYLIKLVTPPGGTVLDPFMGSGSTGVAAFKNNFKFIGIEMSEEYCEIARKRIEHASNE